MDARSFTHLLIKCDSQTRSFLLLVLWELAGNADSQAPHYLYGLRSCGSLWLKGPRSASAACLRQGIHSGIQSEDLLSEATVSPQRGRDVVTAAEAKICPCGIYQHDFLIPNRALLESSSLMPVTCVRVDSLCASVLQ